MKPRLSSLDGRLLTFAHRGGAAHAPENTIEAFELALTMGATGVETDSWLSADGHAVLVHDGSIGSRFRKRAIAELGRDDLPPPIPTMDELYDAVGPDVPISVDLKDPDAFDAVVAAARTAGGEAERNLWLCHPDRELLARWASQSEAKIILSTRLRSLERSPEHSAAELRELGIDGLNLFHQEWTGGLIALVHRFDRYALAWGLEHERQMAALIDVGIDAIYSDHVDRMAAVADQFM